MASKPFQKTHLVSHKGCATLTKAFESNQMRFTHRKLLCFAFKKISSKTNQIKALGSRTDFLVGGCRGVLHAWCSVRICNYKLYATDQLELNHARVTRRTVPYLSGQHTHTRRSVLLLKRFQRYCVPQALPTINNITLSVTHVRKPSRNVSESQREGVP